MRQLIDFVWVAELHFFREPRCFSMFLLVLSALSLQLNTIKENQFSIPFFFTSLIFLRLTTHNPSTFILQEQKMYPIKTNKGAWKLKTVDVSDVESFGAKRRLMWQLMWVSVCLWFEISYNNNERPNTMKNKWRTLQTHIYKKSTEAKKSERN